MKIKKIVALMLALAMVVSGLYIVTPDASEVKAANTTQSQGSTIEPNVVADGMLNVKMQIQANADGSVNLRLVSSVNGLGYKNVGFEVCLDMNDDGKFDKSSEAKEYIKFTTGRVSKRIDATVTGVTYNYSPKVIDTDAEYFVTGTLMGINQSYKDNAMCVKAFCTTMDGTVKYGTARYFNITDATANNVINIPVAMDVAPATDDSGNIKDTVKIDVVETTATLEKYDDAGYAHVNVVVPSGNKTALPSASKVEVGDASAIYRNLESSYSGEGTEDISWYEEYLTENPDETKFVIATAADLYGFAVADTNFEGKTIYMVADIDANIGRATEDGWLTTAEDGTAIKDATSYPWTPIGGNSNSAITHFAGIFDGQMHTISGVYLSKTGSASGSWGLFGETGLCSIKNLILANSYLSLNSITSNANIGSIAGKSLGVFDTIKVENSVYLNNYTSSKTIYAGGIVGAMSGKEIDGAKFSKCWFDGQCTGGNYVGGILALAQDGDATANASVTAKPIEMENCLNSGTIALNKNGAITGGLCSYITQSRVTINNSVNVSTIEKNGYTLAASLGGTIIGWITKNPFADTAETVKVNKRYSAVLNNTYGASDGGWINTAFSNGSGHACIDGIEYALTGGMTHKINFLESASFKGQDGYANMKLDFTIEDVCVGDWTATTGTPVLSSFLSDEELLDLDETTIPRTLWYTESDEEATTYTLYSTADMLGFASLVNDGIDFTTKTVELGRDITLNKGTASATGFELEVEDAELVKWTPINITGTFDGGGHTLSGVHVDSETGNVGLFATVSGTVKNLRLLNSYFECTDSTTALAYSTYDVTAPIGSIAGTLTGTVDGVYSNAIVKHAGSFAGGLVGVINSEGTKNTITNSCYEGTVTATESVGGIVGIVLNSKAMIEHCLFTGKVMGTKALGGFCGYVCNNPGFESTKLTVKDSLTVGSYKSTTDSAATELGALVGIARNRNTSIGTLAGLVEINKTYGCYSNTDVTPAVTLWTANVPARSATVLFEGAASAGNYDHLMTMNAIRNKTGLSLTFYSDGQDSSNDGDNKTCWWINETSQIPMLESFLDLLKSTED